jgi:hypothetical protein
MRRLDALRRLLARYRSRLALAQRKGDAPARELAWQRVQVLSALVGDLHRRERGR